MNRLKAEEGGLQRALTEIETSPVFTTDQQECDGCGRDMSLMEYNAGDGLCGNCISLTYGGNE